MSDTLRTVEVVVATAANDTITGGAEDNYFQAAAGDDDIAGGGGDDTIASGDGVDTIDGGAGFDLVDFGAYGGAVIVDLAAGIEANTGTVLTTMEAAIGSNFADSITGDGQNNWMSGGLGDDTFSGGAGSDTFIGGAGSDLILYDDGDGFDAVFGFQSGVDVIDARAYAEGDPGVAPNIFQQGADLVVAFSNTDVLYLVATSAADFDAATDLRL